MLMIRVSCKNKPNGSAYTERCCRNSACLNEGQGTFGGTFPGAGLISVDSSCSGGFPILPLQARDGAGDRLRLCFLRTWDATSISGLHNMTEP